LGWDLILRCKPSNVGAEALKKFVSWYVQPGFGSSVLPEAADQYFRLERVALDGESTLEPGFAVLVVLSGEADLSGGRTTRLTAGSTAVAPNAVGPLGLRGRAEVLVCRPPRPR